MYLHRTIEPVIREVSEIYKVVLLTGARQCGKSTCLEHLADDDVRKRLSLDDEVLLEEARNSASQFLVHHPLPLFIDEIQRAPNLFLQIKAEVDARNDYGQVWASGSQKFVLMKGVADSLAGRLCPLELMPLSLYERQGKGLEHKPYVPSVLPAKTLSAGDAADLWKTIWQGAWPRVINMTPRQRLFFYSGLVQTYLERDVRTEAGVEKLSAFRGFLRELALRTGQELRIGDIAKTVGVSDKTINGWLSIAENSGLIYLLRPYYANIGKQFVKSPKIYFTDTGLAAYLIGFSSPGKMAEYTASGAFFETFVIMEILKGWVHNGERPEFFFYRDSKAQKEIDLLIRAEGVLHPVEIKSGSRPGKEAIKNFSVLEALPETIGHGAVICTAKETYGLAENVTAHSVWGI